MTGPPARRKKLHPTGTENAKEVQLHIPRRIRLLSPAHVRRQAEIHQLLLQLQEHNPSAPVAQPEFDRRIKELLPPRCHFELPGDFLLFYKNCDGVTLYGDTPSTTLQIRSFQKVEIVDIPTKTPENWPEHLSWQRAGYARFCDFSDGSFAALELAMTSLPYTDGWTQGWKIVHQRQEAEEASVIAWSFEEFLRRALDREGTGAAITAPATLKPFRTRPNRNGLLPKT